MKKRATILPVRSALSTLWTVLVALSCGDGDPAAPVDSISIETASLAEAVEGRSYSQTLEAAGGTGDYDWVLAAGSLPAGLTLSPTGTISGTPVAPGRASFRVRATDGGGSTATADLSLTVIQALAVGTATLPEAIVGEEYHARLQAVGGRGAHAWSMTGGVVASWLSISSDGVFSGVATAAGASTVTVTVRDESGQEASRELSLVVLDPLAVAAQSLPAATEGRPYAAQLVATGGDGAYAWTVSDGALPGGLAVARGGALTGTPEAGGTFAFTVRVTDGAERTASRSLSLTVERAPTIRTTRLPPADVDVAYTVELVATGGVGGYAWSVVAGALPAGLSLSPTGTISGTPTATGSATFTVRVTDEAAVTHTRAFTLVVARIQELESGSAVTDLVGEAGSVRYYVVEVPEGATLLTVGISGGTGDADLYVRRGALPAEFTYDCRPLREGNQETCTFTSPAAGPWYVMLRGFAPYTGLRLVATHEG